MRLRKGKAIPRDPSIVLFLFSSMGENKKPGQGPGFQREITK
jgi:hypothetical protein